MYRMTVSRLAISVASCAAIAVSYAPFAVAQSSSVSEETYPSSGEIIVTARHRNETAIETPVVINTIRATEMERQGIATLDAVARVTPQLIIGPASGSVQGGSITLRGLTAGETNNFADQSVSFNIDGAQVSRSSVQRLSAFDLQQIDVLKGPQALFYGKNSPGGVISIRTADPTDTLQAKISAGYEFEAKEKRADAFISGPITDNLGFRIAGQFSDLGGWLHNITDDRKYPRAKEIAGRLTLKWEPSDSFNARLKVNYARVKDTGQAGSAQYYSCGGLTPQRTTAAVDCKLNEQIGTGKARTAAEAGNPNFGDGSLFGKQTQFLASLEMNHDITPNVLLTSISSVYKANYRGLSNFSLSDRADQRSDAFQSVKFSEINQEFRVTTTFDGIFNATAGMFFQSSTADFNCDVFFNASRIFTCAAKQDGTTYSPYLQLILKPIPELEISGGGRYSYEKKDIHTANNGVSNLTLTPRDSWDNFSPEATISYRPNSNLNIFASYKSGFLSGGFNGGPSVYAGREISYQPQKIKGFEGGIKARLLDNKLDLSFTAFDYKVTDLQVTAITGVQVFATNAGKAFTRGAEFEATIRPVSGLSMRGSIAYNDAKYKDFLILCYKGQSVAQGCDLGFNGTNFTQTQLSGQRLMRAPEWMGSGNIDYEFNVGDSLVVGLNGGASYSSPYFTMAQNAPRSEQKAYWLFDSSIRVGTADEQWELALIGRNLTNKYYIVRTAETPGSGAQGGFVSPTLNADLSGAGSRGREVMLRLTWRMGTGR